MIVSKALYINMFEPGLMNARIPMGIEARLDVTLFPNGGVPGTPYNQDVAAQLQLTPRGGGTTTFYQMPAIDVANGKIRAVIPSDYLKDPNGYRLRLTGTVQGEPTLLAIGTLFPLPAAGPSAVPEDIIDTVNLSFQRGSVGHLTVKLWQDASKFIPLDIAGQGVTITASVLSTRAGLLLAPFTVAITPPNEVGLTLAVEQVDALPDSCWWVLRGSSVNGTITFAEGSVTVSGP